ncbi:hypothetical protein, partial [Pseudomonas syringae group genomosp. 7]|uniref:hypothetical protein n=1 Tax=Pseudomonas syringae group genomosp. 7 TaxID=251699 RepID=UPI00376F5EC1
SADQIVGQRELVVGLLLCDFLRSKVLDALQVLPVELDVVPFTFAIDQLVGMHRFFLLKGLD